MINYEKFIHATSVKFYDTKNLSHIWNIDFKVKKHLIPSIVKLCELWKVPFDEIIDFAERENIVSYFLEYTPYGGGSTELVFKKGLYREVHEQNYIKKVFHDVFVKEDAYIGLTFKNIIQHIIKTYYPKFYLFDYEDFPVREDTPVSGIPREYQDYTMKKLCGLMNGQLEKIRYNIYSSADIISLPVKSVNVNGHTYQISLCIPARAIAENDFSQIEDFHVYSIIKPDAVEGRTKGNFFEGKQKDFPYWDEPVIQDFKKLFLE